MLLDFTILWRYFAWCNQTLAVFTLWAATVYLARHNRAYIVTMIPAMFMSAVSVSYLFAAPTPEGLGQPLSWAIAVGVCVSLALTLIILMYIRKLKNS